MMNPIKTINQWAVIWLSFMGDRIIDSTLVFSGMGIFWILIRKRVSVQFGYCLFLLVLIKLVLPAPISLPSSILGAIPKPTVIQKSEGTVVFWGFDNKRQEQGTFIPPNESAASPDISPLPTPNLSLSGYLMLSWIVLSLAFLARFIWMSWKTRFMINNTIPLNPKLIPLDLERLRQCARIKRPVRWITGDWVKSPMAYGWVHPVIAVPKNMRDNFTANQIRWILLHELAHIHRGDQWISTLQRIVLVFFFFNPLVWWVNSIVDRLREYACDDDALAGSQSSSKECGEGFLGVVMQVNNLPTFTLAALGLFNYETMIRKRLFRIIVQRKKTDNHLSFWGGIWLSIIAFIVLSVGMKFAFAHIAKWTLIPTDAMNTPPSVCGECMTFDSQRGATILHGGTYWESISSETWERDSKTWRKVSDKGPGRYCAGMAFDPNRNVTVFYGGYNGKNGTFDRDAYSSLTWAWNAKEWREADLENRELRACTPLVYFPELQCVIRHGGLDGIPTDPSTYYYNDTCLFDGFKWIKIAEGPVRAVHQMVYDSVRKKIVLFGGMDAPNSYPQDTWEFDGTHWEQAAVNGPPGRHWFGFAFDDLRGAAVLFGGNIGSGFNPNDRWLGDTWEWDGKKWMEIIAPNPGKAYSPVMVYDSLQQKMVMFLPSGRGAGKSASYRDSPNLAILRETWEYGSIPGQIALANFLRN